MISFGCMSSWGFDHTAVDVYCRVLADMAPTTRAHCMQNWIHISTAQVILHAGEIPVLDDLRPM